MLRYRVELIDPHDSMIAVFEVTSASASAAVQKAHRSVGGWSGCRAVLADPDTDPSPAVAPPAGHRPSIARAA